MTTQRQRTANRANSKKSTGPKTASGRARAGNNARRHGLGGAPDPRTVEFTQRIADEICADGASTLERELAMIVAESSVLISRVRYARMNAIEKMRTAADTTSMPGFKFQAIEEQMLQAGKDLDHKKVKWLLGRLMGNAERALREELADREGCMRSLSQKGDVPQSTYLNGKRVPRDDGECVRLALSELVPLARYEQRAMSRRRKAVAALAAIRRAQVMDALDATLCSN